MKKLFVISILLLLLTSTYAQTAYHYPATHTVDSVDNLWGVTVKDPYRWLENLKDSSVLQWMKAQGDYTSSILDKIPGRDALVQEMIALDKVQAIKYGGVSERKGRYFFTKRLPNEQTDKLYFREGMNGKDMLLFNPYSYLQGKQLTINGWKADLDGKKVLMQITEAGKELPDIRILDVDAKKISDEVIQTAIIIEWIDDMPDSFLYLKAGGNDVHDIKARMNVKTMMHIIGTPVTTDKVMLSREHTPELNIKPEIQPILSYIKNSNYVLAYMYNVDVNKVAYYALKEGFKTGKFNWKPLCNPSDRINDITINGEDAYLLSSKDNPNRSLIKVSLSNPDLRSAEIILKGDQYQIEAISRTKNYLIIQQTDGIETHISKMNFVTGKVTPVPIPLHGTLRISGYNQETDQCGIYNVNLNQPGNLYTINLDNNHFERGSFYVNYNYKGIENIVSEEVQVASHDGVMIPLSIVYDKTKLKKDGSNICLMYGYGAYSFSLFPNFFADYFNMMKKGVVLAIAHVRGGGERGEAWHLAGYKTTKPNTWKDFIACTEYMIRNKYTSAEHVAGVGGSAGGIMIGRTITERPDLLKVAVVDVGIVNALRMEFSPNGPGNIPEFGTVKDSIEFKALLEMDAYQHVKEGTKYPATLITTGFNDPRVISWIPAKFAARMQAANASSNPVLLRVDYTTGHFGGENVTERFKNEADRFAFLLWQCGHPDFQMK